jgi:glycosyltransferase involved in cell wall biosynthesis
MRVGLLYPTRDALSPTNWSGTPHGLAGGLRDSGAEVVPVNANLPIGIHQTVAVLSRIGGKRGAVADRTLVRQYSRNLFLTRHLAEVASGLDLVVAMGTEMYDLGSLSRPGLPIVTYDDGSLLQMWRNPDSDIRQSGFAEREVDLWIDRQRASSRAATLCCVSTDWAARSFIEDYGVAPEQVRAIGMGHRPRSAAPVERDWSAPRFLFIGVDWQRKNGASVLKAFSRVRAQYPTARLDVVGKHPRIEAEGVVDYGYLPREDAASQRVLDGLFESATAFVLPSLFDPSPIAYLEAASAGLPVIATTEGGAGELLGEAAISVRPHDLDEIVEAMLTLSDPGVARSMGAKAVERAASSTWAGVAGRLLEAVADWRAAHPQPDASKHAGVRR